VREAIFGFARPRSHNRVQRNNHRCALGSARRPANLVEHRAMVQVEGLESAGVGEDELPKG
jgi:hypothetical protein